MCLKSALLKLLPHLPGSDDLKALDGGREMPGGEENNKLKMD